MGSTQPLMVRDEWRPLIRFAQRAMERHLGDEEHPVYLRLRTGPKSNQLQTVGDQIWLNDYAEPDDLVAELCDRLTGMQSSEPFWVELVPRNGSTRLDFVHLRAVDEYRLAESIRRFDGTRDGAVTALAECNVRMAQSADMRADKALQVNQALMERVMDLSIEIAHLHHEMTAAEANLSDEERSTAERMDLMERAERIFGPAMRRYMEHQPESAPNDKPTEISDQNEASDEKDPADEAAEAEAVADELLSTILALSKSHGQAVSSAFARHKAEILLAVTVGAAAPLEMPDKPSPPGGALAAESPTASSGAPVGEGEDE